MKSQIRYFIVLCLVVNLIFISFTSTYACSPIFRTNYWYQLDYTIANDALPADITVIDNRPPYSEESNEAILGQLEFTNASDRHAYIVPDDVLYNVDQYRTFTSQYAQAVVALADEIAQDDGEIDLITFSNTFPNHILEPNSTLTYYTYKGMRALMQNPQSPGGVEPLPAPFLYEPVIIQNQQLLTIPITVSYSMNPHYNEDYTVYGAPVGDWLINTDAVVLGEVIGAAEDADANGNYPDSDGNAQIVGYARIQVEEWLLGEGPAEIEVGSFSYSPGSDCGKGIWMGNRAYFLLKTPTEADSIRYPLTSNFEGARTVLRANSENAAVVEAALQESAAPITAGPTASPTADEPGMSIFLPYISR